MAGFTKGDIDIFFSKLQNPWFFAYLSSVIVLIIIFNSSIGKQSKTLNVLIPFIASVIQIIYGAFEIDKPYNKTNFLRYSHVGMGIFLFIIAIMNLSLKVDEPTIAVSLLLLIIASLMLAITSVIFNHLWNSRNLKMVMLLYVLFSLSLNFFFAFCYSLTVDYDKGSITDTDGHKITTVGNYLFFSYSNFYNALDGYTVTWLIKPILIMQLTASAILHIIILGRIIQRKLT